MSSDDSATRGRQFIVGEYVLSRKLGSGGFGAVYEARHRETNLPYAVKRIQFSEADADHFRKEALYPARIASQSLHVMSVHSFFQDNEEGYFYLVTELIPNGDLRDFLKSQPKPLPLKLALEVGLGIARGLAAIHAQSIIHRDLKPQNILMDKKDGRWVPKISDFGLARSTESVSVGEFASAGYAAPEQMDLASERGPGPESDMFSFGMILYELLTGAKPTGAANLQEYGRWIREHPALPAPSEVRGEALPKLDELVSRLLEFDRDRRTISAADAVAILEAAVDRTDRIGPSPSADPSEATVLRPSAPHLKEPSRTTVTVKASPVASAVSAPKARSRALPVMIAVAAILVIIAAVVVYSGRPHDDKQSESNDIRKKAVVFYLGSNGKISNKDAESLFRDADSKGDLLSRMWLARSYQAGRMGLPKDTTRAATMAHDAIPKVRSKADGGDAEAEFLLASAYDEGIGIDHDAHQAADLFKKACDGDHLFGCTNLAALYAAGDLFPKDDTKAADLYQLACDAGDLRGCTSLGFMYGNGRGKEQDPKKAAALFDKTCQGGDPQGCTNLGFMYDRGAGLEKDDLKAAALYGKACDEGNPDGCVNLGVMKATGQGMQKDEKTALGLFKRACDGGNASGCDMLKKMQAAQ